MPRQKKSSDPDLQQELASVKRELASAYETITCQKDKIGLLESERESFLQQIYGLQQKLGGSMARAADLEEQVHKRDDTIAQNDRFFELEKRTLRMERDKYQDSADNREVAINEFVEGLIRLGERRASDED